MASNDSSNDCFSSKLTKPQLDGVEALSKRNDDFPMSSTPCFDKCRNRVRSTTPSGSQSSPNHHPGWLDTATRLANSPRTSSPALRLKAGVEGTPILAAVGERRHPVGRDSCCCELAASPPPPTGSLSLASLLWRRRQSRAGIYSAVGQTHSSPSGSLTGGADEHSLYSDLENAILRLSSARYESSVNRDLTSAISEPSSAKAESHRRHKWPQFAMWSTGNRPKTVGRVPRKVSCPVEQQNQVSGSESMVPNGPISPGVSAFHGSFSTASPSPCGPGVNSGSIFFNSTSSLGSRAASNWNLLKNRLGIRATTSASVSPTSTPPPSAFHGVRKDEKKSYPLLCTSPVIAESRRMTSSAVAGRITSRGEVGSYAIGSPRNSSPAADSGKRRRSVRKQRYYGSVEMMVTVDASGQVRNVGRFRVEPGADHLEPDVYQGESEIPTSPIMVEDPEVETRWYFRHFLGREHQNFAGVDNQKAPFFLSVLMEDAMPDGLRCRAILWRSTGSKKLVFPYPASMSASMSPLSGSSILNSKENAGISAATGSSSCSATLPQKPLTARSIVQKFPGMTDLSHGLKEITDPKLQKDLLVLEEQEGAVNFKFGVIYAKNKQESDDEMLSNENGSETFEEFLHLLGDRIILQGWNKFRGGLDAKTNSTGTQSVYTLYEGHEIMFHCSTMLPYSVGNKQQLERKRHIGNDIVNIVFEDEGDPADPSFSPTAMKSQFTHIFAVVTFDKNHGRYRLWVFSEETVPAYGPFLPTPNEFYDPQQFREFLLTKLINGEKAAFRSQVFSEKRYRTTDTLIKDMYIEYLKKEVCRGSLHKVTEAVVRHLRSPRSKEFDNNLVEFVRMGEHLRLTKSMSGEAPNMLAVSTLCRKQPWEPQLLCTDMPLYDAYSSDSWGNRSLVLATDDAGAIFVNEGVCTPLFEPACQVQQLSVLENFGLLIVRCDKGKEAYISVFSLSHMRSCIRAGQTLQKRNCLEHRVAGIKGCQLYAISGNNSLRLSLAVSMGKKLALLRWTSSQSTGLTASPEIVKSFEIIKEMSLAEETLALCLFESGLQANIKVCAATKNGLELVDFSEGSITNLYRCSMTKTTITSLLAACDVESEDILLTFDHTTLVFDLCDDESEPLSISWTANPHSVAYCFPFVLAFGMDTIEIRLAVNGNLFTSLYMPNVRLLAAKEDIFFAVDRLSCPFSNSPINSGSPKPKPKSVLAESKSTGANSGNGTTTIGPPRRWSQLYKIPIKNLLRSGARAGGNAGAPTTLVPVSSTSGVVDDEKQLIVSAQFLCENSSSTNGSVSGQECCHTSPQQLRHGPNPRKPSPTVVEGQSPLGNQACNPQSALPSHMIVRESVGSDSGWSSQGRYSTASSSEVDGSSPPSPGGDTSADVLL